MPIFKSHDIEAADQYFRRNLINSVTGFKSASLLGSRSSQGKNNLAIFTQIMHIGAHPPLMGIVFRPHTVTRDSLENILETKCYTLNHFIADFHVAAHHTSARWDKDEFEACGFTPQFIEQFEAPFVKEAPIRIGLKFRQKIDIELNGTHLVIGEIVLLDVADHCLHTDGFVDLEKAGIVTVSGLDSYHVTQKLSRLSYAKPDHQPKQV